LRAKSNLPVIVSGLSSVHQTILSKISQLAITSSLSSVIIEVIRLSCRGKIITQT